LPCWRNSWWGLEAAPRPRPIADSCHPTRPIRARCCRIRINDRLPSASVATSHVRRPSWQVSNKSRGMSEYHASPEHPACRDSGLELSGPAARVRQVGHCAGHPRTTRMSHGRNAPAGRPLRRVAKSPQSPSKSMVSARFCPPYGAFR
jgi:hypothetical protein